MMNDRFSASNLLYSVSFILLILQFGRSQFEHLLFVLQLLSQSLNVAVESLYDIITRLHCGDVFRWRGTFYLKIRCSAKPYSISTSYQSKGYQTEHVDRGDVPWSWSKVHLRSKSECDNMFRYKEN